jgi:hypothetical protein
MLQRQHQLGDIKPCPLLTKLGLPLQMPKQLPAALEIRDEVKVRVGLKAKLQSDEKRRLDGALEDLALADGVRDFLLGDDLLFREHLHRVDSLGVLFPDLKDAAERAASNEL